MSATATERHALYRRHVAAYLRAVELARGWSQSEIGRQAGVLSTTINKALKLKHSLNYTTLLALESASGIDIHDELKHAAAALNAPRPVEASEVEAFLEGSPEWRRIVDLGRKLAEAADPASKREIKREITALLSKVA